MQKQIGNALNVMRRLVENRGLSQKGKLSSPAPVDHHLPRQRSRSPEVDKPVGQSAQRRVAVVPGKHENNSLQPPARRLDHPLSLRPDDQNRVAEYKRLNLNPSHKPTFTDHDVARHPKTLARGESNTILSVGLKGVGGEVVEAVFKPLRRYEKGLVSLATGVPPENPQTALRNLATVAYAKALGFDVVPETDLAYLTLRPAVKDNEQTAWMGLMMDRASGKSARQTSARHFADPEVARQVTRLQWLHHLVGQGDGHEDNYFIDVSKGRAKVTGIDNDQCFGKDLTDPNGIQQNHIFQGRRMPPVVDSETAKAITKLREPDLRGFLHGLLDEAEIQAAVQRLRAVKLHIERLAKKDKVVAPEDWPKAMKHLKDGNSYVARDRKAARELAVIRVLTCGLLG